MLYSWYPTSERALVRREHHTEHSEYPANNREEGAERRRGRSVVDVDGVGNRSWDSLFPRSEYKRPVAWYDDRNTRSAHVRRRSLAKTTGGPQALFFRQTRGSSVAMVGRSGDRAKTDAYGMRRSDRVRDVHGSIDESSSNWYLSGEVATY
ncbi:hypothetical protein BD311DRAFT_744370 [Dichomitus squalens]|uniref:Uncharacterized protein n=1 Tax=Dichomitus squalens TaxID=114155 RepID=A0A4Q9N8P0_9APHY|nr:hypothetical protein BD311DRAFT_744370 [Dichomitus squalens]